MPSNHQTKLAWCSYAAALYAVQHWHYSRSMPPPPRLQIGVWESDCFVGALVFTKGSAGATDGRGLGLRRSNDMAELARVALAKHDKPVSWILSRAIRLVRAQSPDIKGIISYADPNQDHHGGIYQAANFIYIGHSVPLKMYRDVRGRLHHERAVDASGYNTQFGQRKAVPRPKECQLIVMPPKHKYIYPIDVNLKTKLLTLALPYPKRPKDSSEPLGHPVERGRGSTDPDAPILTE